MPTKRRPDGFVPTTGVQNRERWQLWSGGAHCHTVTARPSHHPKPPHVFTVAFVACLDARLSFRRLDAHCSQRIALLGFMFISLCSQATRSSPLLSLVMKPYSQNSNWQIFITWGKDSHLLTFFVARFYKIMKR